MNNKLNGIPGFVAEASLYKTSGHYQTDRQVNNLPGQMIRTIHPSMIDVAGEVIVIHDPFPIPGLPVPVLPPWWGGHGGTGSQGGPSDGGPSDSGGGGADSGVSDTWEMNAACTTAKQNCFGNSAMNGCAFLSCRSHYCDSPKKCTSAELKASKEAKSLYDGIDCQSLPACPGRKQSSISNVRVFRTNR